MAVAPGKNKLKMGSAGRYYGAYLIYDVANSCLAALHAKMPPPVVVTRTNPPSPVHVQNPPSTSPMEQPIPNGLLASDFVGCCGPPPQPPISRKMGANIGGRRTRIRKDKELIRSERERESKKGWRNEGGVENAGDAKEVEGPSVKPTEVAGGFSPGIKRTR
ncbi:hypothetical protein ALC62_10172 [Cyphomyrmex costatus]|uniref:Uncharacterized protein n=1 Tax=Cyphomyrmex costatus TaxID=456900 RepID=A0A195CG28_9HYME|nr:hypothetical protein ALC62_10172 [Cyphomyrmex costatus]